MFQLGLRDLGNTASC